MHFDEKLLLHSIDGLSNTSTSHLLLRHTPDILLRYLIAYHTVSAFSDFYFDAAGDALDNELVSLIEGQSIRVYIIQGQGNEGISLSRDIQVA
jgi:hypothetical protein